MLGFVLGWLMALHSGTVAKATEHMIRHLVDPRRRLPQQAWQAVVETALAAQASDGPKQLVLQRLADDGNDALQLMAANACVFQLESLLAECWATRLSRITHCSRVFAVWCYYLSSARFPATCSREERLRSTRGSGSKPFCFSRLHSLELLPCSMDASHLRFAQVTHKLRQDELCVIPACASVREVMPM